MGYDYFLNKSNKNVGTILNIGTVIIIIAAWFISSYFGKTNEALFPSPQSVWNAFISLFENGYKNYTLLEHFSASMVRLLSAFFLSIITAVPLGLASGYSVFVRGIMYTVVEFYRPLPPLAYYTLLVLWFGIGNESKIILLYLACFAPIYISCVSAVMRIPPNYINCAASLGANKRKIFFNVILPACLPDIFVGTKTAIGVGYTTLVAAEMVAAKTGIGWMVLDASNYLRSDIVFCMIILMGLTGIMINGLLVFLEKRIVPWSGKE